MDELIAALRRVAQDRPFVVAMESTGTYGDALRARLTAAGLEVHRVGGKAAHDYAEIFDGVPSQHDGKDAAVIAELAAFGKSSPWPYRPPSEWEAALTYWVDWLDSQQRQAKMVGAGTACVLWAVVGDPRGYPCGAAYRKAMGLNLKERSSGKYQGQVKITKRGPSLARRWLYFAAMRTVQKPPARGWYEGKKKREKDRGKGALTAVMRKLAVALYAVGARGEPFEAWRLYPGSSSARKAIQARKGARSRKYVLGGIAGQEE